MIQRNSLDSLKAECHSLEQRPLVERISGPGVSLPDAITANILGFAFSGLDESTLEKLDSVSWKLGQAIQKYPVIFDNKTPVLEIKEHEILNGDYVQTDMWARAETDQRVGNRFVRLQQENVLRWSRTIKTREFTHLQNGKTIYVSTIKIKADPSTISQYMAQNESFFVKIRKLATGLPLEKKYEGERAREFLLSETFYVGAILTEDNRHDVIPLDSDDHVVFQRKINELYQQPLRHIVGETRQYFLRPFGGSERHPNMRSGRWIDVITPLRMEYTRDELQTKKSLIQTGESLMQTHIQRGSYNGVNARENIQDMMQKILTYQAHEDIVTQRAKEKQYHFQFRICIPGDEL